MRYVQILREQNNLGRFIFSRVLKFSGLWRLKTIQRDGYRLHLHPAMSSLSLWVNKERETDSRVLKALLRQGDTYVDVGANIGHLAIEASLLVGKSGQVYAFEAHPRTAGFLWTRTFGSTSCRISAWRNLRSGMSQGGFGFLTTPKTIKTKSR